MSNPVKVLLAAVVVVGLWATTALMKPPDQQTGQECAPASGGG